MLSQEKLEQLALQVGGEVAVLIVRHLKENGENISEFLIAEDLDIGINIIRKTLYQLQENNLVTSMRKKDKKKGWYIYYWTFNDIQAETLVKRMKQERIKNLKNRLEKESLTTYYSCKKTCLRMPFERALENNYTCPECGKVMEIVDNSRKIKAIQEELAILETIEASSEEIQELEGAEAAA